MFRHLSTYTHAYTCIYIYIVRHYIFIYNTVSPIFARAWLFWLSNMLFALQKILRIEDIFDIHLCRCISFSKSAVTYLENLSAQVALNLALNQHAVTNSRLPASVLFQCWGAFQNFGVLDGGPYYASIPSKSEFIWFVATVNYESPTKTWHDSLFVTSWWFQRFLPLWMQMQYVCSSTDTFSDPTRPLNQGSPDKKKACPKGIKV